jgi:hypothetical protein
VGRGYAPCGWRKLFGYRNGKVPTRFVHRDDNTWQPLPEFHSKTPNNLETWPDLRFNSEIDLAVDFN